LGQARQQDYSICEMSTNRGKTLGKTPIVDQAPHWYVSDRSV